MADTPNTLTPDEASAIEAIGGAPSPAASQAAAHEEASEPALHEEASAEDSHPAGEHGNEGGALHGDERVLHHRGHAVDEVLHGVVQQIDVPEHP